MYKISKYSALLVLLFIVSCKKDNLPDIGGTAAQKISNEWWVRLLVNGQDIYSIGHYKLATYNTAANNNEIWVDDLHHGYVFKAKATADYSAMTFTATNSANEYFNPANPPAAPKTVIISGGKVLLGVGKSRAGNVTDSIFMEVVFSDDPGTKYVISGHGRTRFIEDEY